MTDGVMTASFQTSSDDATKLLGHSLSQLKAVLAGRDFRLTDVHGHGVKELLA
jgi:hypothetical protein